MLPLADYERLMAVTRSVRGALQQPNMVGQHLKKVRCDWTRYNLNHKLCQAPTVIKHTDRVTSAVFGHDDTRIATGSEDSTARVWHLAQPDRPLILKEDAVRVNAVAFSPDDRRLLIVNYFGDLHVRALGRPDMSSLKFGYRGMSTILAHLTTPAHAS